MKISDEFHRLIEAYAQARVNLVSSTFIGTAFQFRKELEQKVDEAAANLNKFIELHHG